MRVLVMEVLMDYWAVELAECSTRHGTHVSTDTVMQCSLGDDMHAQSSTQ